MSSVVYQRNAAHAQFDEPGWHAVQNDISRIFHGMREVTTDLAGFDPELKELTDAEIQQLQNIDDVTITNTQWGYVGAMDQGVTQSDSPTFAGMTLAGNLVMGSNRITGVADIFLDNGAVVGVNGGPGWVFNASTNLIQITGAHLMMGHAVKVYFEAASNIAGTEYVHSAAHGYIDYEALTAHRFAANIEMGSNDITGVGNLYLGDGGITGVSGGVGWTYDNTNSIIEATGGDAMFGDAKRIYFEQSGTTKGTESIRSDIHGTIRYDAASYHYFTKLLRVYDASAGTVRLLDMLAANSSYAVLRVGKDATHQATWTWGVSENAVFFQTYANDYPVNFLSNRLVVFGDSGTYANRVGVQTATPGYTLDVNGTFRAVGAAILDTSLTMTTTAPIYFNDSGTYWQSRANSFLTGVADGAIELNAPFTQILNGYLDIPTTSSTAGQITQNGGTRILHTYGTNNFFAGALAGNFTTSGTGYNVGIGYTALDALTTGYQNVGIGRAACTAVTGGIANIGIGAFALDAVTTTPWNVGIGDNALGSTTGSGSTAIGNAAGTALGNASYGVFLGFGAGRWETVGAKLFIDNATRVDEADGRVKALVYGEFNAATASQLFRINAHMEVLHELEVAAKCKLTSEGGFASKLTNKTGVNSVKGTIVETDAAVDDAFDIADADAVDAIGVVYEDGIADGSECWVVWGGIADVLLKDGTAATRHNWVKVSDVAGRADMTGAVPSPPTGAEHFKESGHCTESVGSGTDVLARAMVHFN